MEAAGRRDGVVVGEEGCFYVPPKLSGHIDKIVSLRC
jgi:hypothetical protein